MVTLLLSFKCADANNTVLASIANDFGGKDRTVSECNTACSTVFNHPQLVGLGLSKGSAGASCFCFYPGGVVPPLIPPQGYNYGQAPFGSTVIGKGPIMTTVPAGYYFECFVYAQVSKTASRFSVDKYYLKKNIVLMFICKFILS